MRRAARLDEPARASLPFAPMPRPIQATIDLAALRHNLARAREHAAGRFVWAVAKANAYGHGIERAVAAFADADGLAVLDLDEARRAREAGWRKPVLLLEGFFEAADLALVERLRLATVVHHSAQIGLLSACKSRGDAPIEVYVKLQTGMNRLGFGADARAAVDRLNALAHVKVAALMTHFANADRIDDGPVSVAEQRARLAELASWWTGPICLANSAALLLRPEVKGDAVRPGIVLYGASPQAGVSAAALGLRPAMWLRSRLISVQALAAGDAVGYGSRWTARRPTRLGVVACGYADGYPRCAPDGTPVIVAGRRVPLAGRVSMDMLTVDLTDLPSVDVDAPVELWGPQLPIDEVAERAGTIGYELMCALARRVPVVETH
jgi:alanine racemase